MRNIVHAPVLGYIKDISECSDIVFADKILGDGVMIIPDENVIIAPFDGKIETIAESKHALTICNESGLSIILHIGIDTVELAGKGFEVFIHEGDVVKKGQQLLKVDFDFIKQNDYDPSVLLIVPDREKELSKLVLNATVSQCTEIIEV